MIRHFCVAFVALLFLQNGLTAQLPAGAGITNDSVANPAPQPYTGIDAKGQITLVQPANPTDPKWVIDYIDVEIGILDPNTNPPFTPLPGYATRKASFNPNNIWTAGLYSTLVSGTTYHTRAKPFWKKVAPPGQPPLPAQVPTPGTPVLKLVVAP